MVFGLQNSDGIVCNKYPVQIVQFSSGQCTVVSCFAAYCFHMSGNGQHNIPMNSLHICRDDCFVHVILEENESR